MSTATSPLLSYPVAEPAPVQAAVSRRLAVEFMGTFWLVLGGCGSAVLAAGFPKVGIGLLGVSLAFGLTVLTMAFAFGHISGGHFNPAVSLGLWLGGRFSGRNLLPYWVAQVLGGLAGAGVLHVIASGTATYNEAVNGLAANGYGAASPGGYSLLACFVTEVLLTMVFLYIILGATDSRAAKGFGPLAIGLGLTLIHLLSIPVTNTSVNPARSLGPALILGGVALQQVWLFWVAPLLGAALAGVSYQWLTGSEGNEAVAGPAQAISRATTTIGEVTANSPAPPLEDKK
ncbi:MAG: aquaporin Z [Hymenobacter sp.]|nr:MAG: aquaporin Z [Hymenobacter sp.]